MPFNDYQWHDDYERESVMRAMCNVCAMYAARRKETATSATNV